jgi:PAS domain S-box-containing protein
MDVSEKSPPPNTDPIHVAQRLAAIVESSDDAIISKDLKGIVQSWNKGAEQIFGYTAEEMVGKSITLVIPPELHDQEPVILGKIASGERIHRFETIRQRKDGTQFHVSLTISPIRDNTGKIIGASKIARDISDLRRGQERQELLLREMNHRVKNLFAVANGVVALSARSALTPKELANSVQARLSALSRAHELILPLHAGDQNRTIDLGELVRTVLGPYDHGDQQITLSGVPVECGPSMSTSMALLLHEFATNSVKYGALADAEGRLVVSWNIKDSAVSINWKEVTAAEPTDHDEKGFGSFLVDATVRGVGASINRSWMRDGLSIELEIPMARFQV